MKKIVILLFLIKISFYSFSEEKSNNEQVKIKRTVLILPFKNKNNIEKYNFLQESLLNALVSELMQTDQFNFVNPEKLEEILKNEKPDGNFENSSGFTTLAIKLKADAVVTGQYVIIENRIMIQIKAVDLFTEQIVASTNISGEVGTDIFRLIEVSSKEIASEMAEKLKTVNKTYFDEMTKAVKEKILLEIKNEKKPVFLPAYKTAGIINTAAGGTFFLAGLSIFIYDMAVYSSILREKKSQYKEKKIGYNDIYASYQIFMAFFGAGITAAAIGLAALAAGIPLIVYKSKNKTVSLNLDCSKNFDLYIKFLF